MNSDTDWETYEQSGYPLLLIIILEKHILSHTEDIYTFASVYEKEQTLHTFHQKKLTNDQWYDKFNTKSGTYNSIGVNI